MAQGKQQAKFEKKKKKIRTLGSEIVPDGRTTERRRTAGEFRFHELC